MHCPTFMAFTHTTSPSKSCLCTMAQFKHCPPTTAATPGAGGQPTGMERAQCSRECPGLESWLLYLIAVYPHSRHNLFGRQSLHILSTGSTISLPGNRVFLGAGARVWGSNLSKETDEDLNPGKELGRSISDSLGLSGPQSTPEIGPYY